MKKTFAVLLTALMILALIPTVALAADTTLTVGPGETYTTIQAAIDAVGLGTTEIVVKAGTYNETVLILQATGKNIIITGEDGAVFKGNMIVDGNNRHTGPEMLTIQNLKIDKSGTALAVHVYIIDLKKYAHNVTIDGCSFVGDDSGEYTFAIQAGSAGGNTAYNTVIKNSTFTHLDCAVQARCQGLTLENVTVTDTNAGINAFNSRDITLINVRIAAVAPDFALRLGENGGVAENGTVTISGSVLSCPGGDAIVFRASSQANVIITSSDIMGNVVNLSPLAMSLTASNVYWGGSITGFAASQMNISASMATPHFNDTEVVAGVDPTYIIVIPSAVNFGTLVKGTGLKSQDFDVTAQNVLIESGALINVSVTSPFTMKDLNGAGSVLLAYTLASASNPGVADGEVFASFTESRNEDGDIAVDTAGITKAGAYQGTMVFNISYVK